MTIALYITDVFASSLPEKLKSARLLANGLRRFLSPLAFLSKARLLDEDDKKETDGPFVNFGKHPHGAVGGQAL